MNAKLINQAIQKLAAVTPIERPTSGQFARMGPSVYSDKGKFYQVTTKNGRTATVYERPAYDGKAGNLAVETPGRWSANDISELANELYSTNGLAVNGNILGVGRDQFESEVTSHDYMDTEGGPHAKIGPYLIGKYKIGPFNIWDPVALTANGVGRLLKKEKDPAAITDMRGTSNGRWPTKAEGLCHRLMQRWENLIERFTR